MDFLSLDPLLRAALQEDLGRGDITTDAVVPPASRGLARIHAQEALVLAGWPVFLRVFQLLGKVEHEARFEEGQKVEGGLLGVLRAEAAVLLKAERVALNFLQRMCGVATLTRRYVELVAHTGTRILDTRKTTPLWRDLEKYAVRAGGGHNHRMGLDDGILIKENHIAMAGGIAAAVRACRERCAHLRKVEVEVRNLQELVQALEAGCEAALLDNMAVDEVREAVRIAPGRCLLEVSGGVNENNVVQYAETGVDFISLGVLTHSYPASDISMLVEPVS